ncbi:chaperone modulator CbpM [Elongatibacter sediminis]|uniref:Chaperone modulator CbpM n=1 Tax=Elongatibacter sediminis TaxID=3119006 RepID=A0AAW9RGF4_9GAMM
MNTDRTLEGDVLTDDVRFSIDDVCRGCRLEIEELEVLVEEGIAEPRGARRAEWRFSLRSVRRVRTAVRLQRDLGVNAAGAALAVELLERIAELERRQR